MRIVLCPWYKLAVTEVKAPRQISVCSNISQGLNSLPTSFSSISLIAFSLKDDIKILYVCVSMFPDLFTYVRDRVTERQKNVGREIFHLLAYSPNGTMARAQPGQSQAKIEASSRTPTWVQLAKLLGHLLLLSQPHKQGVSHQMPVLEVLVQCTVSQHQPFSVCFYTDSNNKHFTSIV